jgi:hypothetical protein
MTLRQLRELGFRMMPKIARFPVRWWRSKKLYLWVPGHELAHALLAKPEQLTKRRLGMCKTRDCRCRYERCHLLEACATTISCAWHIACGRPDLAFEEMKPEVTWIGKPIDTGRMRRRVIRRLKQQGLWPIPTTIEAIKAAFRIKPKYAKFLG